jgi:hypothetical protein
VPFLQARQVGKPLFRIQDKHPVILQGEQFPLIKRKDVFRVLRLEQSLTHVPVEGTRMKDKTHVLHIAEVPTRLQFRQLVGQFMQLVPFLIVPEGQLAMQLPKVKTKEELQDEHSELDPPKQVRHDGWQLEQVDAELRY